MAKLPLYKKIMQDLESKIAGGDWTPESKLPTEVELEQAFDVSNITIRHALKGLVEKGLITRVRGGGSFVNKFPSSDGQGEVPFAQKVVGLIMPVNRHNGDMMDIVCGVSQYCFKCGYLLNINHFSDDTVKEEVMLERLAKKSTGIIYYPQQFMRSFECMYALDRHCYPIVTVDQSVSELSIPYVTSDNFAGAYEATKFLLKKGHRKICFVSVFNYATTVRERFKGFCHAMEESGVSVTSDNYIISTPANDQNKDIAHDEILNQLLSRKEPVTAVLTINDYVAYELLQAASRKGVGVPDDLSIIGYDNLPFIEQMKLPLMTVSQDLFTIGERAAQVLIDRIEGRNSVSVTIPVKLIERASVKNLSASCKNTVSEKAFLNKTNITEE